VKRLAAAALVLALFAPSAAIAKCKKKGDGPQVFVKGKTAIRRGNGLNYPVSKFLEEGKCMTLQEVSLDEAWLLVVDETKTIGWVPVSAIDAESRDVLPSLEKKTKGPIGSGQERGFLFTKSSSSLLARPDASAEVRKVLPSGARVLGLAVSEDGKWVQVRDDRGETGWVHARGLRDEGDTISGLPVADNGIKTGLRDKPSGEEEEDVSRDDRPKKSKARSKADRKLVADASEGGDDGDTKPKRDRRFVKPDDEDQTISTSVPQATGLQLKAAVLAMASLPRDSFDSNGAGGNRRYLVKSLSFGGQIEAIAEPLGAFRARMAYSFVLLTGLTPPGDNAHTLGAQEHYLDLLFGYPIELGRVRLIPEAGYAFALFAMEPYLPGSTAPQFLSSHTHGLSVGMSAAVGISETVALDLSGAGLVGTSVPYPFKLGSAGIAVGATLGAGLRVQVGGGAAIIASYRYRYRQTPFTGKAQFDPTITSATITHLDNSFGVGLSLTF
jgi:SH3-like domain-containing protein